MWKVRLERNGLLPTSVLVIGLALFGCGPRGSNEVSSRAEGFQVRVLVENFGAVGSRGGTLFSIRSPEGSVIAAAGIPSTWSTYCANDPGEVHFFVRSPNNTEAVTAIPKPDSRVQSGYGFVRGDSMFAVDLANGRNYRYSLDGRGTLGTPQTLESPWRWQCPSAFEVGGMRYEAWAGFISACSMAGEGNECDNVLIADGSWVYAYAEAAGSVLAATNYGDILIHRSTGWCRAVLIGESYRCPNGPELVRPPEPTGKQFYSSINYYGQELLGQFPSGKLYQFDGVELRSWHQNRPLDGNEPGLEAQSLASYCGDLYVGYWPRGEIWRYDGAHWVRVTRLFTHPTEEDPLVPYSGRSGDGLPGSFFGQRVTALSLVDDSLFAFTSNLGGWTDQVQTNFISAVQASEYGGIHRLRRASCLTFRLPPSEKNHDLLFEIGTTTIRVRRSGVIVAEAAHGGILPQNADIIEVGHGVFGTINGPSVEVTRIQ
jgi:hypothetical protein